MNLPSGIRFRTIARLLLGLLLITLAGESLLAKSKRDGSSNSSSGTVQVHGYTRKDGTYVAPYTRTAPNSTKNDNWSTKGNVNPYTGKRGTKNGDTDEIDTTLLGGATEQSRVGSGPSSADTIATETQPQRVKSGWNTITPGMTKSQVLKLLGEPNIKTDKKWVYSNRGTLIFTPQGQLEGIKT